MRFPVLCTVTLMVALMSACEARSFDLPPSAQKLVDAFEKEAASIGQAAGRQLAAKQTIVLDELLKMQIKLTQAAELDDAVVIRDCLRAVAAASDPAVKQKILASRIDVLPASAKALVKTFDLEASASELKAKNAVDALRASLIGDLSKLLTDYTRAAKLDEAVAVRDWIAAADAAAKSSDIKLKSTGLPGAELEMPEVALPAMKVDEANVDRFIASYREQVLKIDQWLAQVLTQAIDEPLEQLRKVQEAHTQAGQLDEAVFVRDLIKSASNSKTMIVPRISEMLKSRSQLSSDAKKILDELNSVMTHAQSASAKEKARLAGLYAERLKPWVASVLATADPEKSEAALRQLSSFQPLSFLYGRQIPPVPAEAQDVFDEYLADIEKLLSDAEQAAAAERKTLVEALRQLPAQKDAGSADLSGIALELLTTEAVVGLLSPTLAIQHVNLPADSAASAAAKKYIDTCQTMKRELRKRHQPLLVKLRDDVKPVIVAKAHEQEFADVYAIQKQLENQHQILTSVVVSYAPHPIHPPVFGGKLLDINGKFGLVDSSHGGGRGTWYPVDQIVLPEMVAAARTLRSNRTIRIPTAAQPQSPGARVSADTALEPGQVVLIEQSGSWVPAVIVQDGSKLEVQMTGPHPGAPTVVDRKNLRFPREAEK